MDNTYWIYLFIIVIIIITTFFIIFQFWGNTKEWVGMKVLGDENDQGASCEILKESIKLK